MDTNKENAVSRQAAPDYPADLSNLTVTTTEVGPAPLVPGLDPLDVPDLDERQAFAFAHAVNPHITRRRVRDSVLRGELVGVRHGNKNLFSRRTVVRWMLGGES